MTMIRANNISKKYIDKNNFCIALNNVNISVKKGDFISIVGKSGAGKSTLLYILAGLKKADSGEVFINDKEIGSMKDKELSKIHGLNIGFVFQDGRLIDDITVWDNITLPGYIYRRHKEVGIDAKCLLENIHMSECSGKYPKELSAGQIQRAAIARALINDPDILLLDEPTGNLDIKTGRWIYTYLRSLNKKGKTVILVTHELYAASLGNRVWVMSSGQLKGDIAFREIKLSGISERMKYIYNLMYKE